MCLVFRGGLRPTPKLSYVQPHGPEDRFCEIRNGNGLIVINCRMVGNAEVGYRVWSFHFSTDGLPVIRSEPTGGVARQEQSNP
jgi:hypothetical protein